jgi:putative spermidine/putrescine transport system substrate-binding protein
MKKLSKLLLALSFVLSITTSAFAVTIASWGGAYTESQKLGYGDPTAKKLGIPVNWVDYTGGLSEIKAQKEAGKITWDIIDVYAKDTIIGCDEGIFVEFDFDKDFAPAPDGTPASEDYFTSMPSKCAVGNILYSWNFAYNNETIGKKKPKTIKDFFNTKKFPGKRAIYKGAMSNLEIAMVGAVKKKVRAGKGNGKVWDALEAEGGVDKAIAAIKDLCQDPKGGCVFWNAGAQPPELLANGEVVMATGWNGRFFNAQMEGTPITQVWDNQILDYEYFAMVKGGPNDANGKAKKVLREMLSTEGLAGSAKYIAYAPWRKSSIAVIDAGEPWYKDGKTSMVQHMPTAPANTKKYMLMNPTFWADNQDEINEKWEAMKAGL